jgi:Response regulator containing a CheY-like receiver domain and an HTH DNA-binding domain
LVSFFAYSKDDMKLFDRFEKEVRENSILNKAYSEELIKEMYSIASKNPDSISLMARTLSAEVGLTQRQGIVDSTLLIKLNRLGENENLSTYDRAILDFARSNLMITNENYTEAYQISLEVFETAKQLNDSLFAARALNTMGVITNNVSLSSLSREYYEEAGKWAVSNPHDYVYYLIKVNILSGEIFEQYKIGKLSRLPSLAASLESLMTELKKNNENGLLVLLLLNSSNFWTLLEQPDKTLDYLMEAKELCQDNQYIQSLININIGTFFLHEKSDYLYALDYFKEAQGILEQNNMNLYLSLVYYNISQTYEYTNQLDSSLLYLQKSVEVSKHIKANEHIADAYRKYISASLEVSENKLALAHSEILVKNRQFLIIIISSTAFIIILGLAFVIFWQKQKSMKQQVQLKDAESKELTLRLEKEQSLKKFQEQQLQDKLREITSYSLRLASKNQVMNQVLGVLNEFPNTDKTLKRKISQLLKESSQTDNDWNDFMLHFNRVHPLFFEHLNEQYPGLSQNEIKLTAYIRLGLSIKQIAQMLNVTPESVKTSRYRLRKKMDLTKDDALDLVIQNL